MQKKYVFWAGGAVLCILLVVFGCMRSLKGEETQPEPGYDYQVRIAVIDTGISITAIGDRYIMEGYNYVREDADTTDTEGHGTQIASILTGSEQHNIEGICENAVLIPFVFSGRNQYNKQIKQTPERAAKAIYAAVDEFDCDIINLSAGMHSNNEELRKAVAYAVEKDVLIIASAGNDGTSEVFYPGGYEGVLCVGSLNAEGEISEFSQQNPTVDLYAIGENIAVVNMDGTVVLRNGTSYSAAFVTGVAANLLSQTPELTIEELTEKIKSYVSESQETSMK